MKNDFLWYFPETDSIPLFSPPL